MIIFALHCTAASSLKYVFGNCLSVSQFLYSQHKHRLTSPLGCFFCTLHFLMWVLVWEFFRAGRRASTLTHGRMLTTASTRSPTASASCSKLYSDSLNPCRTSYFLLSCLHSIFPAFVSHHSNMFCVYLPQQGRVANTQCAWREGINFSLS